MTAAPGTSVTATAPGRVNLIGDHVDYVGGLVLPVAVDLHTTVAGVVGGDAVVLTSDADAEPASVSLATDDPAAVRPRWARHVAGVVAELRPPVGLTGTVTSTIPVGSGLSSSAALSVAVALALGFEGSPADLARRCQRAEQRATGVPCGIMDQLAVAAGVEDHGLLIDCRDATVTPVPIPPGLDVVVVHSGQRRALTGSAYAERRAQCEAAEAVVGPLRDAHPPDLDALADPVVRRRAAHVVGEIRRVEAFAAALAAGDAAAAGALMVESHRSLRDLYEVSTPALDALVEELCGPAHPAVHGARLTGAGFGGCVVALADRGGVDVTAFDEAWVVRPSAGARVGVSAADGR